MSDTHFTPLYASKQDGTPSKEAVIQLRPVNLTRGLSGVNEFHIIRDLRYYFDSQKATLTVETIHPYACDADGSLARTSHFLFEGVRVTFANENWIEFTGFLTKAYYPDDLDALVSKLDEVNKDTKYPDSYGFPYLPEEKQATNPISRSFIKVY